MGTGFRLVCSTPERRQGRFYATAQAFLDDVPLEVMTLRLDDPDERAKFSARVRSKLNGQGETAGDLDARLVAHLAKATAPADDPKDMNDEKPRESQATKLAAIALEAAELFHDERDEPFARLRVGDHLETWPTRSKRFRLWLSGEYYQRHQTAVGSQAIADARNVIDARARLDGPCRSVYLRTAPDGMGGIYVDLSDDLWRAVHVTALGWQIVQRPPVCFRRSAGMLPFPDPVRGGRLDDFRAFVNVPDDDDWALVKAWQTAAVRDRGPYPVLALQGGHGSAKSTLARMLRQSVDPARPELRGEPRELRDLAVAAQNSWVCAFDNVSHLPPWLSDALCSLATGSGWATRELYSDLDEVLFDAMRPVLLNGITEFISRGDLLDRALQIVLPSIEDGKRRREKELWAAFETARPALFGALLDSVAGALGEERRFELTRSPRMADFAKWAVAGERARDEERRFFNAYDTLRASGHQQAIEASIVHAAFLAFLDADLAAETWEGSATDLLVRLTDLATEQACKSKYWPRVGQALGNELRRLAPSLRATHGVVIDFSDRKDDKRRRLIVIRKVAGTSFTSFGSFASSGPLSEADYLVETEDGDVDPDDEVFGPTPDANEAKDAKEPKDEIPNIPNESIDAPAAPEAAMVGDVASVLIASESELRAALPDILAAPMVGVDTETTGLDPRSDRLRLVQLAVSGLVYVVDCFRVPASALAPVFDGTRTLVGHNLKFDLHFLAAAGIEPPTGAHLFDVMLAAQLLGAGTADGYLNRCGLAAVAKRYLDTDLAKDEQRSDWGGPLTEAQRRYAARDAAILLPLHDRLREELAGAGLERVATVEMRALPAIVWLERTGAPFEVTGWCDLSDRALVEQLRLKAELTRESGTADLFSQSTVNWSSPAQITALLRQRGHDVKNADENTLVGLADREPLARLILDYRDAAKRVSTYGVEFAKKFVADDGRIHADFLQIGAASSGRMSCHAPNLQNIPRDKNYRGCFRPPAGRCLVKADYSQIELRIAAEVSGDREMLEAYQRGEDLHVKTAAVVLEKPVDRVGPTDRQAAKAVNFGLIYGMGADGLRDYAKREYGVDLDAQQAAEMRNRFFETYAGLRGWHRRQPDKPIDTRTLAGRRRLDVDKFTEKLNSPVQGTGADGTKAALALLWETRDRCPGAAPILCVHDEIVVECDRADAEAASAWVVSAMERGMASFVRRVPIIAEANVVASWAGEPIAAVTVGSLVNCLDRHGTITNPTPLRIVQIDPWSDGRDWAMLDGEKARWPLDQCELAPDDDLDGAAVS